MLPHKYRWSLLLGASCIFYMAFVPKYILILGLTIVVDYFAGIWIEKSEGRRKKILLWMSIICTCAILFSFKYFNFFNSSFASLAHFFGLKYPVEVLNIILPIGLSFHTFQSLSYVIEVYRGKQKAETHFGIYSLYVMFYPQMVAGPIERPQNLLHQFWEKHPFCTQSFVLGMQLMLWGFFKKVVIADRSATIVNYVYGDVYSQSGLTLLIGTVFFALQIYCDFSGYSDIAIGAARVMGFKLMKNFERPYYSKSISEFWRRWHISLSTWFKDYLYIPLGGNKVSRWRWYGNLFLTFVVSGLWHGANWTYVIWGALNGFYLVFAIWTESLRGWVANAIGLNRLPRLRVFMQVFQTFALICIAWVFFRAKNLQEAIYVLRHICTDLASYSLFWKPSVGALFNVLSTLGESKVGLLFTLLSVLILESVQLWQRKISISQKMINMPLYARWMVYLILIAWILCFGRFDQSAFIYFQF